MPLRLKLFLGIVVFFALAFGFFGYTAYSTAVKSNTKHELALLRDLSESLSEDLGNDVTLNDNVALSNWLATFKNPELAIIVVAHDHHEWFNAAARDLPATVRQAITSSNESGSIALDDYTYAWHSTPIAGTPFALRLAHRARTQEIHGFFRSMIQTLLVTGLVVAWAAVWSTLVVASLIEKLKSQNDRLQHQALHDALTGLPNRTLMRDRLDMAMRTADRTKTEIALLMIDLNRFKEINDSLGHYAGDRLLVDVSGRLAETVRKSDTVARLGGDEFAVVLTHLGYDEDTTSITSKLSQTIRQVSEIDGNDLYVTGSIGIARYPRHARDAETLIRCADIAMYTAKRSNTPAVVYNAAMDEHSREQLALTNDLSNAIDRGQLTLNYQPKIRLDTGTVVGAEALLRWSHPELGQVSPELFIPIAEQTGLIAELTRFVLDTALRDLQGLVTQGHDVSFAVNLSAVNLQDPELVKVLQAGLEKWRIAPHRVVLEITETAVMDKTNRAAVVLQTLNELGFIISMDDFGTGHSSLINLRHLPLHEIKIDRAFVTNMLNKDDSAIVRSITELGRSLGKSVVAEGVENDTVLMELQRFGCNVVQGYHISPPLEISALATWLAARRPRSESSGTPPAGSSSPIANTA